MWYDKTVRFAAAYTVMAMIAAVGLAGTALSQQSSDRIRYIASRDIAVVQGPVLAFNGMLSLEHLEDFAGKNGFSLDRGSLPGSPDYHIGVSPVIMANSHADGTLTIALVQDGNDQTDYKELGTRFKKFFIGFGFEELQREPVRTEPVD